MSLSTCLYNEISFYFDFIVGFACNAKGFEIACIVFLFLLSSVFLHGLTKVFFSHASLIFVVGAYDQYPRTHLRESLSQIFNQSAISCVWAFKRIWRENVMPNLRFSRNYCLSRCCLQLQEIMWHSNGETEDWRLYKSQTGQKREKLTWQVTKSEEKLNKRRPNERIDLHIMWK